MTAQARLLGSRYQVGELLGYGGMAEVHRGRDLRLSRDVAIKMLRSDLARDATFQLRFQREAQNAASLNHPAIVAVYDTGEERGPTGETLPYIVMEFVNGRTLKEILGVEGRLMPRRALEITADICAALEFSHRHQIIHRDIKPGNVMLTQAGQVKVMDFGIARALASGASTMTQTSAVIGTAQYLSPEQARGEPVDARSDVYATGCLLFELLTGHPPFTGDNPVSVVYQHVREEPPAPSYANPDVPPDVDAVVLKALAKNPMNRYQSAAEMRADLLRAATGRPVYATPVMREDEVGAMVAPGIPTQVIGARPTGTVARVGNAQSRRASGWALAVFLLIGVLAAIAIGIGLYLVNRTPTVGVPNLVGKSAADAASTLNGLKLNGTAKTVNGSCIKGNVISQSQPAGTKVNEGTTIRYDVCGGPGPVTLPNDVVGQDKDAAKKELEALGLKVNLVGTQSDQPVGQVIDMKPQAGQQVDPGTMVTLTYSTGNNQVQVGNLVGQTAQQAETALQQAGLKYTIQYDTSAPLSALGNVTKQDPQPGTTLTKGDTVTIWIGVAASNPASPTPSDTTSPSPTGSPSKGAGG